MWALQVEEWRQQEKEGLLSVEDKLQRQFFLCFRGKILCLGFKAKFWIWIQLFIEVICFHPKFRNNPDHFVHKSLRSSIKWLDIAFRSSFLCSLQDAFLLDSLGLEERLSGMKKIGRILPEGRHSVSVHQCLCSHRWCQTVSLPWSLPGNDCPWDGCWGRSCGGRNICLRPSLPWTKHRMFKCLMKR